MPDKKSIGKKDPRRQWAMAMRPVKALTDKIPGMALAGKMVDKMFPAPMDREDMSKALKAQRKSATKQRKRTAELRKADRAAGETRRGQMSGLRGGGMIKMGYKKGGSVKSKSIDGIAQHGKTRGTMR
tara:strand:- start:63 stop:446 length:384 start_codon:yes stop_codon:yes gene_type:complete